MAARRSGTRHLTLVGPQARVLQTAFRSVRTGPAAYAHGTGHAAADPGQSADSVTDPLCGMTVDPAGAAAHAGYAGQAYYFCSEGCARQFAADPLAVLTEATDPVCGMPVRVPDAQFTARRGGVRYVFCGSGCRDHFAAGGGGRCR
jgi:YHS domain-containing protein